MTTDTVSSKNIDDKDSKAESNDTSDKFTPFKLTIEYLCLTYENLLKRIQDIELVNIESLRLIRESKSYTSDLSGEHINIWKNNQIDTKKSYINIVTELSAYTELLGRRITILESLIINDYSTQLIVVSADSSPNFYETFINLLVNMHKKLQERVTCLENANKENLKLLKEPMNVSNKLDTEMQSLNL